VRAVTRVGLLVTLWILAWGELTLANVLSGILVAVAVLVAFPPGPRRGPPVRVDLVGSARLGAYVLGQLVTSNVVMAGQILRRRPRNEPGVLAHHLRRPSGEVVTIMTTVISLSPGTMTVDVSRDSSVVYVHFFDLGDLERARAFLVRLEALVAGAIPETGGVVVDAGEGGRP
jgi:multicomponent Na+:H+ antiporter subunit E